MLNFLLIFLLIGVNLCLVQAESKFQVQKDLPLQQDLDTFLKPIENFTNYIAKNFSNIEINSALGLFFTNVQLGRVLLDKSQKLSKDILPRIKAIVDTNEESLRSYHLMSKKYTDFMERDYVIISDLFINSSHWIKRLKKFKYEAQLNYTRKDLEDKYSIWQNYSENVDNVFQWIPSPENSDTCLVTLAVNPKAKGNAITWCPIADICYYMLKNGTDFSYALCHRLAVLIMAQLGQGCFILSVQEDEDLKQKLCTMAYAEAEYIAMNDYSIVDLILEIMCLCAIDGRVQFLRRTWLLKMIDIQNTIGCFGVTGIALESFNRKGGADCNIHTTSVASGTYAAAVRYILEEYY